MFRFIKNSLGLFSSGFILFSMYKYFLGKKEKITEERIIKLVKKIGNFGIHVLFKRYDSKVFEISSILLFNSKLFLYKFK